MHIVLGPKTSYGNAVDTEFLLQFLKEITSVPVRARCHTAPDRWICFRNLKSRLVAVGCMHFVTVKAE